VFTAVYTHTHTHIFIYIYILGVRREKIDNNAFGHSNKFIIPF